MPVAERGAAEQAAEKAAAKLKDRLCARSPDCEFLGAHIRLWRTGSNDRDVCAMAVIKAEELDEWEGRARSLRALDKGLETAVAQLLGKRAGIRPRVAVDFIRDMGVNGGPRAEWLRARMETALQSAATLVTVPRGWAGDGVPPGFDLVVRGDVIARSESRVSTLEVNWEAVAQGGRRSRASAVTFPESASPHRVEGAAAPIAEQSPGLSVHLDSERGGSLCAGERTQVWLKSDAAAQVRVFDLYGEGEALLMFPNDEHPSGAVPANASIPLGGKLGFEAVPVPGSEMERFLVVAAPTEAGLGPLARWKTSCRVPADVARQLHAGSGIPAGAKVASTGYRLSAGASCSAAVSDQQREGVAESLGQIPICR